MQQTSKVDQGGCGILRTQFLMLGLAGTVEWIVSRPRFITRSWPKPGSCVEECIVSPHSQYMRGYPD